MEEERGIGELSVAEQVDTTAGPSTKSVGIFSRLGWGSSPGVKGDEAQAKSVELFEKE